VDQGVGAAGRAEAGRAEVGLGGVGVAEGRRRRQPAGTLALDPVDVDTGLPAQRSDGIADLLISATSERRQPTPIIQICARRGLGRHAALGMQNGGYLKSSVDNAWWAGISAV
jgi:hypothetical protein